MNNIIIGTAGHVDHGKTCLIRALTGIETDRLSEEKKRGITIELGFAYLDLPNGERAGIIDVPGHEKFMRNMLAGAGGIDLALLIVAADEGVMPQTLEHLGILSLLDIKKGIVVLTKSDTVDSDWQALVAEEISEHTKGTFLENAPIMPVSSVTGDGIDALRNKIFEMINDVGAKKQNKPFRIPIDRVFSMDGFGTVITGTMIEGHMNEGDEIMVYPSETLGKVRNVQVHSQKVQTAFAGQRVAVNLSNLKKSEIDRGDVLAPAKSMMTTTLLDVKLTVLKNINHEILNSARLHFYHGSRELLCKTTLLDRDKLSAGENGYAQLRLEEKIAVKAGDRFVVRFYSPLETIGGGVIIDPAPQKHKRNDRDCLTSLAKKERGTLKERLEEFIHDASAYFHTTAYVALQMNTPEVDAKRAANELAQTGAIIRITPAIYVHRDFAHSQATRLCSILDAYHKENPLKSGIKREELRSRFLPNRDIAIVDGMLAHYDAEKLIKSADGSISLFDFSVKITTDVADVTSKIEKLYIDAAFTPPATDEVIASMGKPRDISQVHNAMIAAGTLVRMDSQISFHREHYDRAVEQIREYIAQNGNISLGQCRDLLGTSRKYAVAILETLDRQRITKMVGDARILM